MNIKFKSLLVLLLFSNLASKAQVNFDVIAGANMGNIVNKNDGTKDAVIKPSIGYIINGNLNFPIKGNLLLQTGLEFESIHNKVNTDGTTSGSGFTVREIFKAKAQFNYVNIPIKVFYKLQTGANSFMFGAGPYLGIGVGGKTQSSDFTQTTIGGTTTNSQYDYSAKVKFGDADTALKRINFGVGINLSYVLAKNINLSAYSNLGLANISNANRRISKTYTYGITVGYIFGRKDEK